MFETQASSARIRAMAKQWVARPDLFLMPAIRKLSEQDQDKLDEYITKLRETK